MAATKDEKMEVKKFKFGELVPSEVTAFDDVNNFDFKSLDEVADFKNDITEEVIRSEREFANSTGFKVHPRVEEHRGLKRQAAQDYEDAVAQEVQRRFEQIKDQAYQEGFQKGQEEGKSMAYQEATQEFEAKTDEFVATIDNLNTSIKDIFQNNRDEAYLMVKNLTKWVILKEVDEKYYLVRLLEKLIHEINTKSNLVIRVNESAFGYMPEVVKIVERKLGKLTNVRMEVDLDQQENGIILESENTIVNGSLEAQFKSIDRLFENVGLDE